MTRADALRRLRAALEPEGMRLSDAEADAILDAVWEPGEACPVCGMPIVPKPDEAAAGGVV